MVVIPFCWIFFNVLTKKASFQDTLWIPSHLALELSLRDNDFKLKNVHFPLNLWKRELWCLCVCVCASARGCVSVHACVHGGQITTSGAAHLGLLRPSHWDKVCHINKSIQTCLTSPSQTWDHQRTDSWLFKDMNSERVNSGPHAAREAFYHRVIPSAPPPLKGSIKSSMRIGRVIICLLGENPCGASSWPCKDTFLC